jgi:hypothetical protein
MNKPRNWCQRQTVEGTHPCYGDTQRIYIRSEKKLVNVGFMCMRCRHVTTT